MLFPLLPEVFIRVNALLSQFLSLILHSKGDRLTVVFPILQKVFSARLRTVNQFGAVRLAKPSGNLRITRFEYRDRFLFGFPFLCSFRILLCALRCLTAFFFLLTVAGQPKTSVSGGGKALKSVFQAKSLQTGRQEGFWRSRSGCEMPRFANRRITTESPVTSGAIPRSIDDWLWTMALVMWPNCPIRQDLLHQNGNKSPFSGLCNSRVDWFTNSESTQQHVVRYA